jgi:hypothetical protein
MNQHDLILIELARGWLSPLEAVSKCGTMKLATRIGELRRMLPKRCLTLEIEQEWREGNGKRWMVYRLVTKNT